jgi:hypothetical protein
MFGFPTQYILAFVLLILGASLIVCGTTVCWLRWGRCRGKSVEQIRREQGKKSENT